MRHSIAADPFGKRRSDPCGYDDKLAITVHRFDHSARTCRCGRVTVGEPAQRQRGGYNARCKGRP